MPDMFTPLAVYNGERSRGIVHTDAWVERMSHLQDQFDTWAQRHHG